MTRAVLRQFVAVVTLVATTAALGPAVAAPADRHCHAGHEVAVTAGADHACHPATAAPCATGGCLAQTAAVAVVPGTDDIAVADRAVLPQGSDRLSGLPPTGPPTPPPNS